MKFLGYIFFRLLVILIGALPFGLLYRLSDLLRFILIDTFKYRTAVIQKNIEYCFPTLSLSERHKIIKAFNQNFIDILLESFKGLGTSSNKIIPRFKLVNPELIDAEFNQGHNVIIYSQHYNNWEWGPLCLGKQMKHHLIGIVKYIKNQHINNYMLSGRTNDGVSVIPTYETAKLFDELKHENQEPKAVVFIADQRPFGKERKIVLPFFERETLFHLGAAHYAIKSGYPVYSLDVHRKGRGIYEIEAVLLKTANEILSAEEMTIRYATHLEKLIKLSPAAWLWSHKRFKESIKY